MSRRGKVVLVIREDEIRTIAKNLGYALTADQLAEVCECVRADEEVWCALIDRLRVLAYPSRLLPGDVVTLRTDNQGIVWL